MKHALFTAVLGLALLATPLFAQEREGGGERRQGSPLKAEMEKLDEAIEAVTEFLKKHEGDAPMAEVAAAEAALNEAKKHEPRATQRQPEDKRADFVRDYKIGINKTLRLMLDLEDALLQKNWKAAEKALADLEKAKKEGHQVFKPRRQRGGAGGGEGGGERGGK